MQVKFSADYDWPVPPLRRSVIAYKAGRTYSVTHVCAEEAVAAGKGEIVPTARRDAPPAAASQEAGPAADMPDELKAGDVQSDAGEGL